MQFSTVFFTLASGLLLLVPGINAIACDPLAACNANNHYSAGHSCKYVLNDDCSQNGPVFSGTCVATDSGLRCQ